MKLKELLTTMEKAMDRYDLSDDYLGSQGCCKRDIGEYQYGISMVPCDWVYPYLHALDSDPRLSAIIEEIESEH